MSVSSEQHDDFSEKKELVIRADGAELFPDRLQALSGKVLHWIYAAFTRPFGLDDVVY